MATKKMPTAQIYKHYFNLFCKIIFFAALFFLFLIIKKVNAQEYEGIDLIIEQLEDEDAENADWLEWLWELRENPLNLNEATLNELNRIPFLPSTVAEEIINYRQRNKGFRSLSELKSVEGLSEELFDALSLFVTVKGVSPKFSLISRTQTRLEYPQRRGYREKQYQAPLYAQNKLLFGLGPTFSGGVTLEKDAGEVAYLDHRSFYLHYQNLRKTFSLIAGDYQVRMGSGLVLWSVYGMPLSPAVLPLIPEVHPPIDPNRSTNEFYYLRGMGLQYALTPGTYSTIFYSNRKFDAALSEELNAVSSLHTTGYHRTISERSRSDNWKESLWGITLQKSFKRIEFQLSGILHDYNLPYQNYPDQQRHISFTYRTASRGLATSGEWALFQEKFPAWQQNIYVSGTCFKYQLTAYYYHPDYFSLFGKAFGSLNRIPENRMGAAFFLNCKLLSRTTLGGYVHIHRSVQPIDTNPYLYRDYLIELTQKFKGQELTLHYKHKYRENDLDGFRTEDKTLKLLRVTHKINLSPSMRVSNRIETIWASPVENTDKFYGLSVYHQIEWKHRDRVRIIARWTSFDIPDYNLRTYEYEHDLPGNLRMVLLNNRGYKWYLVVRWNAGHNLQLDVKYHQRYYPDLTTIGSGWDEIRSNRVHEFRLSCIIRY
ncbi:MAG: helix-hairpin-helix domain-containing protein [Calditrichia bacterium]